MFHLYVSFQHKTYNRTVSFWNWWCYCSWLAMSHDLVVELWSCDKICDKMDWYTARDHGSLCLDSKGWVTMDVDCCMYHIQTPLKTYISVRRHSNFTDVLDITDCVSQSHLTVLDIMDCLLPMSSDSMIIQGHPVIHIRLGFKN